MVDKEQLLIDYFEKELTAEQELQFNKLLAIDADFKAQFNFEKNLQIMLYDKASSDLKAKLVGFEKDLDKDIPVRPWRSKYQKWAMAASIALLVAVGWLGYTNFIGPNYGNLYESNFSEYPNTVFAITRGEALETIEREAFVAYELGDHQTAIANFNKIPKADRKPYFDFYRGVSQMSLNKTAEAKQSFSNAIASNSDFVAEAHWYLALIALKEEDKTTAVSELTMLTAKFQYNKEKALLLLKALE